MRQLIQAAIALALIFVLHFIKQSLHHDSPSYFFFYNLISCYELLILILIIGLLLFQITIGKKNSARKSLFIGIAIPVLLIVMMEILCSYLLNHPKYIPAGVTRYFRIYNSQFDLNTFQGNPQACRYDSLLFYSIRPNARVLFSNREYADSFIINQKGFRASENESIRPEIISVGDSYAMGIGVNQNETYTSLLERRTGMNALNCGVSSYGTARESIALPSIDTSNVKYIIWQYCSNDASENKQYVEQDFHYTPPGPSYFQYLQAMNAWNVKYFPGKYFLTLLKILFRYKSGRNALLNQQPKQPGTREQAINFLEIIRHSGINFSRSKIIVFELDSYPVKSAFADLLTMLLKEEKYKPLSNYIIVVDMSNKLKASDYFILDNHINAFGHRAVADVLQNVISGRNDR